MAKAMSVCMPMCVLWVHVCVCPYCPRAHMPWRECVHAREQVGAQPQLPPCLSWLAVVELSASSPACLEF